MIPPLPLIIAHRGASHDAPENTLAALALGWDQHADAAEIDIHLTADRRIAVLHDATTQRTCGSHGTVSDMTMDELASLDAGIWKGPAFAGQRIPTLDQALAIVPDGKKILIEIKSPLPTIIEPLRDLLAASLLHSSQIIIHSFDITLCAEIKHLLPAVTVTWLDKSAPTHSHLAIGPAIERIRSLGLDGFSLHYNWPIDAEVVRAVHAAGLLLYVWTVNGPAVARHLVTLGVDGLITDRPGWLRSHLAPG